MRARKISRTSVLWPRFTGTWNGLDMQQQGFDYAYDKRLYDRLREGHAGPVREHFHAGLDYQNKLARFLENHDEPWWRQPSRRESMKLRRLLRFCHRGCVSFTKDNSKDGRNGFRRIWFAAPRNRSTRGSSSFTTGC